MDDRAAGRNTRCQGAAHGYEILASPLLSYALSNMREQRPFLIVRAVVDLPAEVPDEDFPGPLHRLRLLEYRLLGILVVGAQAHDVLRVPGLAGLLRRPCPLRNPPASGIRRFCRHPRRRSSSCRRAWRSHCSPCPPLFGQRIMFVGVSVVALCLAQRRPDRILIRDDMRYCYLHIINIHEFPWN